MSPDKSKSLVENINRTKNKAYDDLLQYCLKLNTKVDEVHYMSSGADFATLSGNFFDAIHHFQSQVSTIPFLAIILLWARSLVTDKVFGSRHIIMMQDLLEKELISYRGNKRGDFITLAEFAGSGHIATIDKIRSCKEWLIDKREDYVNFYVEFANWLSEASFGLVHTAVDPDKVCTINRKLPFDIYVTIIKELSDRDRILAKLFYLGGARALEEILSLKVEDIDMKHNVMQICGDSIKYPRHVFEDIREYIGSRRYGYVFVGKHGERVDHTVPYRSLKTVVAKLKLDPSFTFKDFVINL